MTRRRKTRFAYRVGEGVTLEARPELGVGIVLSAFIVDKHVSYFVEWPADQSSGLQSRRDVAARELRPA